MYLSLSLSRKLLEEKLYVGLLRACPNADQLQEACNMDFGFKFRQASPCSPPHPLLHCFIPEVGLMSIAAERKQRQDLCEKQDHQKIS